MNTLQKYEKYFFLIILIGIVIYFPTFFNGFVWDDFPFIINNPQVHHFHILSLFGPNIFNSGVFYRPIPAIYFSLLYALAGPHAFLYHFLQLALHILCDSLLFLFFCSFFNKQIAFFLALIFLVNPINVESVAFIGASQSELYFLPGIIALLLIQTKEVSKKRFLWIFGLLLLSALTKETGILFFPLALSYRYLFKLDKLKEFLFASVVSAGYYLLLRIVVGGVKFQTAHADVTTFLRGLINIPPIIFYYLKTFLFPFNLTIWQEWYYTIPTFQYFFVPLFVCLLVFTVSIWFGFYLSGKQKINLQKHYLFFSLWFVIGIGIVLQIPPLEMTVADRWFYFPMAGLLGMLGVFMQEFFPLIRKHTLIFSCLAVLTITLFSLQTMIRTFDFKDNMTLYAHDTKNQVGDTVLMNAYFQTLRKANKTDEAIKYLRYVISQNNNPPEMKLSAYNNLRVLYKKKVIK